MTLKRIILALCLFALQGAAVAQSPPDAPAQEQAADADTLKRLATQPQQDLYLEAMQAINEGRQSDASAALGRMLEQGPRNAGEWLDLALIQCSLGHTAEAIQLFSEIEQRYDPPQGIRDIISQQREAGCAGWEAHSQWSLSVARGRDENVNQGASNPFFSIGDSSPLQLLPEYLPHPDSYTSLTADYNRDLDADGDIGFVQAYARSNSVLSAYNTISVLVGIDHMWSWGNWRWRGTAMGSGMTLGGRLYQGQEQLQLRVNPPLTLPAHTDFSIAGNYSHMSYKTLTNFDSNTLELRSVLGYRGSVNQAQLSLGALKDNAVGLRPGGNRYAWTVDLYGHRPLFAGLEGELEWTHQSWYGSSDYSPGLIDIVRRQNTGSTRATLTYPVTENSTLQLEWRQVHNNENISIFQYNSKQVQLSWRWHGGH